MSILRSTVILAAIACATILTIHHADIGMSTAVPKDMPRDANFLPSGFDLSDNEAQGDWIACRVDAPQATDWCRVTDQQGAVVYQGDFLPLNSSTALPEPELKVASADPKKLWVRGPAEGGPVPVIPLKGGRLLVPAADRDALNQRWSQDPREYDRVSGQE